MGSPKEPLIFLATRKTEFELIHFCTNACIRVILRVTRRNLLCQTKITGNKLEVNSTWRRKHRDSRTMEINAYFDTKESKQRYLKHKLHFSTSDSFMEF